LAVLGGNDNGLRLAGRLLTEPELRGNLKGNFLIIDSEQIVVGDRVVNINGQSESIVATVEAISTTQSVRSNQSVQISETAVPEITAKDDGLITQNADSDMDWIISLLGLSIGLMMIILFIVFVSSRKRKRRSTVD
jgi:hypothetical protein